MRIWNLSVRNFRGIRNLDWSVRGRHLCLVGPGDATKSTILDAIAMATTGRAQGHSSTRTSLTAMPQPDFASKSSWESLITPHGADFPDHQRADLVRLIAAGDPDHQRLYGLRNDAETLNSLFKRTLLVDRATSLGWRRQLLDLLGFGLLNNALALHHHGAMATITPIRRVA